MRYKNPRRTKIIATMGPAINTEKTLSGVLEHGVNVIRLNFSHGTHEQHKANVDLIRKVSAKMKIYPAILLDLQGPKIRTGEIEDGGVELIEGNYITFTPDKIMGTKQRVSISYANLCDDVKPGDRILMDDGLMDVIVEEISIPDVKCKIVTGGILKAHKGVNLPSSDLSINPITEKDKKDLKLGIELGVDFIALSFVRTAEEIIELKKIIHKYGVRIPVIAKIEKGEAVTNIDAIIESTDGIMVARGDLGVETSPEDVPLIQKMLLKKSREAGKPVIIATQMLESMISNPRPTRAEATDVANAVFDGTDAVMLSGETAIGKYPDKTVAMMDKIARKTENAIYNNETNKRGQHLENPGITDALADSISHISENLSAKYIIAFTYSGNTAKLLSKYRPTTPVIAMTHSEKAMRDLSMYWGIQSILVKEAGSTDEIMDITHNTMLENNMVQPLDIVVISTGIPLGTSGTTNTMRILQFPLESHNMIEKELKKQDETFVWTIDEDKCIYCGICSDICSCRIFETTPKSISINETNLKECFFDKQCVYSCPVKAISMKKKNH